MTLGFTAIAVHELGHAFLHQKANTPFLRKNTFFSDEKIEMEANTFAVELLVQDVAKEE
jgi:Zn-dependent peptidase ImmA (M78 family)